MTDSPAHGIAETPEPPYVAVIFTSTRTEGNRGHGAIPDDGHGVIPDDGHGIMSDDGYAVMAAAMDALAAAQPGYLGVESAREGIGITVSYWADEASASAWKQVAAHLVAQRRGREVWYRDYRVRVATVRRDYGPRDGGPGAAEPRPSNT